MILLAGLAGLTAGAIVIFLSHVAPRLGMAEKAPDMDVIRCFGYTCTRRESHVIGVAVHAIFYFVFGMVYGFGVTQGIAAGYAVIPLAVYAVVITIVLGGVVLPLEGHGLFGWREDHWFTADLLASNMVWALLFGAVMSVIG